MSTTLTQADINSVPHPIISLYPWLKTTTVPGVELTLMEGFDRVTGPAADWKYTLNSEYQLNFYELGPLPHCYRHILQIPQARLIGHYGNVATPDQYLLLNSYITGLCRSFTASHYTFSGEMMHALKGRVASIASEGSSCYFHWMCDILPRLKLLEGAGLSYDHLVTSPLAPFQIETLKRLNVDLDCIVQTSRDTVIEAEHLIFPSYLSNSSI